MRIGPKDGGKGCEYDQVPELPPVPRMGEYGTGTPRSSYELTAAMIPPEGPFSSSRYPHAVRIAKSFPGNNDDDDAIDAGDTRGGYARPSGGRNGWVEADVTDGTPQYEVYERFTIPTPLLAPPPPPLTPTAAPTGLLVNGMIMDAPPPAGPGADKGGYRLPSHSFSRNVRSSAAPLRETRDGYGNGQDRGGYGHARGISRTMVLATTDPDDPCEFSAWRKPRAVVQGECG
ncbi:hypothetical protein QFC19_003545 [Naganishia cerealis]|uniref:Uncharacterized protein n=1 Tax=Naganishia cerealis TaxID=610337 RepID=A0ACC2W1J6_9TREE|nr:hypothetical protein QFC19_003545 [Naganishia cerealis]